MSRKGAPVFTQQPNRLADEKWKRAYALFERALELPAGERLAFSQRASQDPEVLRLVLELLESEPPDDALPHPGRDYGRFAIGDLLGRGGMGEVYSARDKELNREVAMKFLSPHNLGSSGLVERLIKEARAASALNHPGIVTVYEVIRSKDSLAIVMERVEGMALRKMCGAPNPAEQVARWGRQIAEALAAAHTGGVVHRDIKPENLMIRPDGYVKVLDFGVAVQIGAEDDLAGIPIGTLGYMSPEQIEGKPLTGASDVFSLGVVVTELATGRHPFLQDTAELTSRAIQTAEPGWLTGNQYRIAEPLGSLLRSMLAKEPEGRPSAAIVAARLAAIAHEPAASAWKRWTVSALAALIVCLAMAAWLARDQGTPGGAPRILPVTAFGGLERNPSLSPDGDRIAFAWNGPEQDNWDIYVKRIGEDVPRRLTMDRAEDFNPIWSPDGRQIAFLRKTPDSEAPLIVIVPADGGTERPVTRTAVLMMGSTHPIAWWPDSKSLVYQRSRIRELGIFRRSLETEQEERLTSVGNRLHNQGQPVPIDERRLALVLYVGSGRCAVCLAVRGNAPHCLDPGENINGLVWEADKKSLLYATTSAIWRVPVRGDRLGKATRILNGAFPDLTGDRQARRLAFTKSYSDLNVWKIAPGARQAKKLIASSAADTNAAYSPDGERIVFTSDRSGSSQLYVSGKDGSGVRQLTSIAGDVGTAEWSPDGKWIAFEASAPDTRFVNIYIVSADGGAPRRLTDDAAVRLFPTWSQDGNWIYFVNARRDLWKIPSSGGTALHVVDQLGLNDPRFSADGRYLYSMKLQGPIVNGGIRRLELASGAETMVGGTERAVLRNWTLGRNGIYFVDAPAPYVLRFLDLKRHRVSRIANLPEKPTSRERGLNISPDGTSLLYTSVDTQIGDIMLIEGIR
jgi:eukaryotic-like serine/threonine-protein kinase